METPPSEYQTPPLASKDRRYKPIWRILLISNLALGGNLLEPSVHICLGKKENSSTAEVKAEKAGSERPTEMVGVCPVPVVPKVVDVSPVPTVPEVVVSPVPATIPQIPEETPLPPAVPKPLKVPEPIPEDQQCELFKWILKEKRKVKPKNCKEKKRIDEGKAILKQFIRSESIPRI